MENEVYDKLAKCVSYALKGSIFEQKRHLELFPVAKLLSFVAVDIL